jgi:hypothetical protein
MVADAKPRLISAWLIVVADITSCGRRWLGNSQRPAPVMPFSSVSSATACVDSGTTCRRRIFIF